MYTITLLLNHIYMLLLDKAGLILLRTSAISVPANLCLRSAANQLSFLESQFGVYLLQSLLPHADILELV